MVRLEGFDQLKSHYKKVSDHSHRGGPDSNPGLVMWDFVMNKSGAGAGFL
jgi:hypothetical protein